MKHYDYEGFYLHTILKVQKAHKKAFLVTNREDPTRSHPEHGRKDSLR